MDYIFLFKALALALIIPVIINVVVFALKGRAARANQKMHPLVVISAFASCFIQAGLLIYGIV